MPTDTRAALAEALASDEGFPGRPSLLNKRKAEAQARYLAERGVLLVTEERLREAARKGLPGHTDHDRKQIAAAIFAALSGEVTEQPDLNRMSGGLHLNSAEVTE